MTYPAPAMPAQSPEISDVIVAYDPASLARVPVRRDEAVATLRTAGNRSGARIVEAMRATDGVLDEGAVDAALIRAHLELQRLSEEFRQGQRVCELVRAMVHVLRRAGAPRPIRVVDVGCGMGYVVRWLAARGDLGDDVELLGCDYNAALVREATRLAQRENLRCSFRVANAFTLEQPAAIYTSTGVVHHFRGPDLTSFFRAQDRDSTQAFFHFDIHPSWLAPLGSWLFHRARMREPLARHDGILSAARAHPAADLMRAAGQGAPELHVAMFATPNRWLPILRVMRPVVGVRPGHVDALRAQLGARGRLLGERA